ncbi:type II secretion system protein [Photobacterium angustum]
MKNKGFTLLESIITISVLNILISMAAPQLPRTTGRNRNVRARELLHRH